MKKQGLFKKTNTEKTAGLIPFAKETGNSAGFSHSSAKRDLFKTGNDASFIIDLNQKSITVESGICSLIGQKLQSKGFPEFLNLCHPDDRALVQHIFNCYLSYCLENVLAPATTSLNFTCRFKKENKEVKKLLCQVRAFEVHEHSITKLWVNITNINFITTQSNVSWTLQADAEQRLMFKERIAKKYENLFTPRETEVIKQMHKGLDSAEIGQILFISHQTVATHRKRILKKSNRHSANELLSFCKERGIL